MNFDQVDDAQAKKVRDLSQDNPLRVARYTKLIMPSLELLRQIIMLRVSGIDNSAPFDIIERVYSHNPDTMMALVPANMCGEPNAQHAGLICNLPLTEDGHDAFFDGRLDTAQPDTRFIARQHEPVAAVYFWFITMPERPTIGGGIALVVERMTAARYRGAPMYCKAANGRALHLFERIGFVPGAVHRGRTYPAILAYNPTASRPQNPRPSYDSYSKGQEPGSSSCSVIVARTADQLSQALAMRAATFFPEHAVPYREDADGNDFCASHLVGYVGDEPAASMRVRWFAEFAKIERLAVLPRFRRSGIGSRIVQASIDLCRAKGYRHIYGQAAPQYLDMWKRYGFSVREGAGVPYLTNETYHEIDLFTEPTNDAVTAYSGAHMLVRPEGQWHRPGVLEGNVRV